MITTLQQARNRFSQAGLFVGDSATGLMVGSGRERVDDEIHLVRDPVAIGQRGEDWIAVFPGEGQQTVEVPATLDELVRLVLRAYETRNRTGEEWPAVARGLLAAAPG